jgi:hypothetical protein
LGDTRQHQDCREGCADAGSNAGEAASSASKPRTPIAVVEHDDVSILEVVAAAHGGCRTRTADMSGDDSTTVRSWLAR